MFDADVLDLAARVIATNRAVGRTIVTAESCTGGLVAAALTEVAGSSDVVDRAFVTYSNEAKMEALGVHSDLIDTFGAVSIAVAWAMAQGALKHSSADTAVAITGIAGPGGGSTQKPVGTVVFAVAHRDDPECKVADTKAFGDLGRSAIRRQAVLCALELLLPRATP
jgi:nicotinamide-nucleotide amidase